MKNLKRVLSLALSGIMLVGMMAVSAGAVNAEDFTDADEITHTEAVSISTALKIIDGKEDGSFDPNGFVTRSQMAKMITRAMFGGDDPVLGLPGTPTFTDIKGRWDETYIEYCANNTIINGRGDGTFDPEGNVTGTEAAKMLLTALGYKADIYGLVGPDWAITTNSIANQTKVALYGGLKGLDPSQPFTRDQVAQMIYNALNANTREMNPTMEITGKGDITYQYTDSGRTLLYDKYGAVRVEGVVKANEFTDNSDSMKGKTTIALSNVDELKEMLDATPNANPSLKVASGRDVFERAVIVYVKPANNNKKDLSKGVVISDVIYDVDTNVEFTTTDDKKMTDWPKDQGLKFELFGDNKDQYATFYANYADVTETLYEKDGDGKKDDPITAPSAYGEVAPGTGKTINTKNNRGTELTFIDNDGDGVINAVLKNTYAFGQVTKYNTKGDGSVTVRTTGGGTLAPSNEELANIVAYEDIAQDDYVMTTKVDDTYYITKCDTVNGDLEDYENLTKADEGTTEQFVNKTKSLTVDSSTHKVNQSTAAYTANGLKDIDNIAKDNVLTEEVTLYLDAFGYAVAGETNAASDFLFVANAAVNDGATGLSSATLTAFVYLEDGTSGSYVVDKYSKTGSSSTYVKNFSTADKTNVTDIVGKLFKYSMTSGGKLVLTAPDTAGDIDSIAADNSKEYVYTVTDGKQIDYDKELSKLTIATSTDVRYVTMDTPVFFVSLETDNAGASTGKIDKVRVYSEKTAPSMSYTSETAAGLFASNNFKGGVSYVTSKDSRRDLDAVVFVNTKAVASDWIFLIDYVKTVDDGRIYNAIVNGEVTQITANDKTVRAVPNAYGYAMDGDLYDLDDVVYSMADVGPVTLIDRKSVIIDDAGTGIEAKMTNSTITAYLDGKDTDIDVAVNEGDVVVLVQDSDGNAEGIFVIAEYDDTKADVVYTAAGVTYASNKYTVDYDNIASITGDGSTAADVAALKALFVTSGKASVKWLKDTPSATLTGASKTAWNAITAGDNLTAADVTNSKTVYLLVLPESEDVTSTNYSVYTVDISGS